VIVPSGDKKQNPCAVGIVYYRRDNPQLALRVDIELLHLAKKGVQFHFTVCPKQKGGEKKEKERVSK